jgi:hypothetical protein
MPSTNPEFGNMQERVRYALKKRHLEVDVEVADTIAIVAAGYLEAMGGPIGLLVPPIPEKALAMRLVLFFSDGHKPYPPTKGVERHIFRGVIDGLVAELNPPVGDLTKATLASLALGAWDETAEKAMKTWIAGYFYALFKAGLD